MVRLGLCELAAERLLVDESVGAHVHESVQAALTRIEGEAAACLRLPYDVVVVRDDLVEPAPDEVAERGMHLEPKQEFSYLLLQRTLLQVGLPAGGVLLSRAVVVDVAVDVAVLLSLEVFLGRDGGRTAATSKQASIGEVVASRARLPTLTEKLLDGVVGIPTDERLVRAVVPVAASLRPFELPAVEGVAQQPVDGGAPQRPALGCAEPPLPVGQAEDLQGRPASEGLLEHLADEGRALRIEDDDPTTLLQLRSVAIAEGGPGWEPSGPRLVAHATQHVHGLVVILELGLTAEDEEEELVVGGIAEDLERSDHLAQMALVHKVDECARVHRVAAEPVGVPGEDAVRLTRCQTLKHLAEDRAAWLLGACALGQACDDIQALAEAELVQLAHLGVDAQNLHVLPVGGLARVEDVLGCMELFLHISTGYAYLDLIST